MQDSDYETKPIKSLKSILDDGYKIAFIGFHKDDSQYQHFDNFNNNMKMYSGFNNSLDLRHIREYDFFFSYIDCMSHALTNKLNEFRSKHF